GISNSTVGTFDASWEIDLFGGIKFAKQAAEARVEATQSDWHTARVSLAAEVATNYVDYRACQLSVAAYQQAMTSKSETSRLTKILADAGFSAPADASLAEASLRATESSLINQQAQCNNTVKALVALTNINEPKVREILFPKEIVALPQPAEFNVDSVPANLITQRPDLIADERNLAAASADTGVATANRFPKLSLLGSIGHSKISSSTFSSSGNTWSFGPSISLPIFDGSQRKADVTIAEANYAIALATYQQDVRDAVKEVEQTLVNLDSAVRRESTEKISTEQYRRYYKAAEINWRAGGISLITLEDARRQLITAELSHITQQKDRVQYWIALYKALGGGWQYSAANTDIPDTNSRNVIIGNESKSNESKK
ncbi:MAG: efflux transporter outer membrane subunit, partial [Methylotenera sp.]